ncbi:hypothetical protein P3T76_012470 [Phytophthora citrophthora]|uniref:Heterogeneous nuclear ribonucleoprotein Q acidic domain-containing protein n=1 Tax=Phytophthora citrophthora TaxID=4793 RepID=A0AAD9LD37_9STRA|nr:hypothetical protein P3T76_012470 [Phytophthora citrophthora]
MEELDAALDANVTSNAAPSEQVHVEETIVPEVAECNADSAVMDVEEAPETTQMDEALNQGEQLVQNESSHTVTEEDRAEEADGQLNDVSTVSDPVQEGNTAEDGKNNEEDEVPEAPPENHGNTIADTVAALNNEQEAVKDAPVEVMEDTEDEDAAAPTHDEREYDPSAPTLTVDAVPHGEDEYDPANPSPAGTPMANNRSAAAQEEYDPDHPAMTVVDEPAAMDVDQNAAIDQQSTVIPAKRKAEEELNASSAPANGDPKRPRHVEDIKSSTHDEDHKQGRHRRGSGDSTASSSSKRNHQEEDHKGLSAAAWDRLMDFQTSGEFRVTQVSRAAFASVGAMPEFAQISIIARFVRTPMKEIRDKNGQLMRIYREYQKENPQVAALQPVDVFISDYKSDPGLFHFGYAPPQPATGVSNVQVPYQKDQPKEDSPAKNSPRPTRNPAGRLEPERHPKDVDEFGRVVHQDKLTAPEPAEPPRTANQRPATDPRVAPQSRQGPASPTAQAMPRATTGGRAEDPRRRDQPLPQNSGGAGRDPRRRGSMATQQASQRGGQPDAPRAAANELYERLSPPVKFVVDSMRREGRLQEPLNDNVVTRLLHLPERVALQAVENFSNVDLSQVENLQGFLVGIINRVNEKAIASEKQHRPQVPSPRGQPPSTMPRGGGYGVPQQGASVLGGPPQGGRLNSNNGGNAGGYRGQQAPMAAGPGPALYERPYEAPQDSRDPRRRQPAPQAPPQYGGPVRGPAPAAGGRAPVGMQSFTALPISVQNHVHSLVANHTLASLEELGGKCYEVLGQLSEPLANQVLARFAGANLSNVRNKSGFLIGVVKRARQEYGFN